MRRQRGHSIFDKLTAGAGGLIAVGNAFLRGANAVVKKLTVTTITTAGAATYTAAQMLGGIILRDPAGAGRTDVTPTAAQIVAAITDAAAEDSFDCWLVNTADAAEAIALSAGTGVTLVPATISIAQNENALLKVRVTDAGDGSEAVTIYAINAGG